MSWYKNVELCAYCQCGKSLCIVEVSIKESIDRTPVLHLDVLPIPDSRIPGFEDSECDTASLNVILY